MGFIGIIIRKGTFATISVTLDFYFSKKLLSKVHVKEWTTLI